MKVGDTVYYVDKRRGKEGLHIFEMSVLKKESQNKYRLVCDTGQIIAGSNKQKKLFKTREDALRYIEWKHAIERRKRDWSEHRSREY